MLRVARLGRMRGAWCRRWFFFFKQKTAYELRISDWSSDVCSSALKGRVSRRVAVSQSPACSASRMRLDEITSSASSTGATISVKKPRRRAWSARVTKSPQRPLPTPKSAPVTTPGSEEHMSEHQSLMPQSYDVFCSQKKIQYTQHSATKMNK